MKRSTWKKTGVFSTLILTGLLSAQFAHRDLGTPPFNEQVNLALRRTAHLLLLESGDSLSRIPPVVYPGPGTFAIRLARPFQYDHLPTLLQESFRLHGIQGNYDVALLDCTDGTLQLGYNTVDVTEGVPCGGRVQAGDCYDLQVRFHVPANNQAMIWWTLAGSLFLGGIFYALWPWVGRKNRPQTPAAEPVGLPFGQSSLDLANQTLWAGPVRHPLTYRETKLLHLFVSHPHELLERDRILQDVWKDEGLLVGRSVDVFVSRLRKMLRDDPTVRIVTVHGIGYRLEVS